MEVGTMRTSQTHLRLLEKYNNFMDTKKKTIKKKKAPIKYGDYGDMDDDKLCELREELMDNIEKWLLHEHRIEEFHELMEVERELTLREDR